MEQDKRKAELISQYSAADPSKSQAEIEAAVDAYLAQDKQADAPPATTKVGGITPGSGYAADSGQRPRAVESGDQLGKLANTAEYMLDNRYGGFPGQASDALESLWHRGTTYEGLRNARQARRNTLSTAEQIATSLAGNLIPGLRLPSVVPSMGSFGQAITDAATKSGLNALAMRTLGRAVESGVQGAATGYVENAGSTSGGVAPAVSGFGLGSLFGLASPLLGKVIGGTASAMSAGKRKAVEALEDAVRNNPFRKPSAPVQYGATIRDVDTAPESVLSALQGAVDRIPGRVAAKGMLASDAAREAGAMRGAAEHATGVSQDQGSALSVAHNRIVEARNLADKEATAAYELAKQRELGAINTWGTEDAAGKLARETEIAAQNARVAAAKNAYEATETARKLADADARLAARTANATAKDARRVRAVDATNTYNEAEAARNAAHEAEKVAFAESERGMGDVLDVLGNVGDRRAVPSPHTTLTNITKARKVFAEKAYPEADRSLAGIVYKADELTDHIAKSPVLQKAWRAAVVKRMEMTAADPSYPALPTKTVNGEIIAVPDAVAWNDVQQFTQQASEDIAGTRPLDQSKLAISGAKAQKGWLAKGQHPKYQEIDAAFEKSWDEQRALVASSAHVKYGTDPSKPQQSVRARIEAQAKMGPEDLLKDQDLVRDKLASEIRDSKYSPGELIKRLEEPDSKESAMVFLGWGAGARKEILDKLGRPKAPGSYQSGPKPVKEQPVPSMVGQRKYIPSPKPEVEAPIPPWLSAPRPPEVAQKPAPGMVSGREQNFATGRRVFDLPMDAGAKDPAFDIPNEISRRAALSAADRATAQQAGGAALQARLAEGKDVSPDASGKFTDQFLAQLGLASKSPEDAKIFEDASRSWSGARALREALTGGQVPSTAIDAASLAAKGGRLATPNLGWTGSRIAHAILETFSGKSKDAMAEEIVRMVLAEPGSTASAIKQLQAIRGANVDVAMKAATILGRVGGSAAGNTDNLSNEIVEPYVPKQLSNLPKQLSNLPKQLGALATPAVSTATPTAQDTISRPLAAFPVDIPRARLMTGAVPGVAETLRPLGPRGLPEVPDGRGLSSLDGLATARPPVTIEAPRPSVIDRVKDVLGVSPLSAAEVGRPKTSAALPGGLVRYTRIGDVPKTFYDDTMDIIRHEEGFVPYVYDDKAKKGTDRRLYMINGQWRQKDGTKPEGKPTIGHGLTDPEIVNRGTITEKESEVFARAHMAKDVAQMIQKGSPISPILASESYNMGVRRMENKNVFNLLRNGKYEEAADSLATVRTAKGSTDPRLDARRLRARQEMLKKSS